MRRTRDSVLGTRTFVLNFWGGVSFLTVLIFITGGFAIAAWNEASKAETAIKRNTWGENGVSDNCADHTDECQVVLYNTHRDSCITVNEDDGESCTSVCYDGTDDVCSEGKCTGDAADAVGLCDTVADCPNITFQAGQDYRACVDGICVYASGNATWAPNATNCHSTFAQKLCEANLDDEPTYKECMSSDSFCQVQTAATRKRSAKRRRASEKKDWAQRIVERIEEIQAEEHFSKKRGVTIGSIDNTCIYTFSAPLSESPFSG